MNNNNSAYEFATGYAIVSVLFGIPVISFFLLETIDAPEWLANLLIIPAVLLGFYTYFKLQELYEEICYYKHISIEERIEKACDKSYDAGYEDGYKAGYDDGHHDGYAEATMYQ